MMEQHRPSLVLDSSGVMRSSVNFMNGYFLTSASVLSELASERVRDAVEFGIRIGRISIKEPGAAFRARVEEAAANTGDGEALSGADLDVLALALEHGIPIVSDDYAVQNTAAELGVEYKTTLHDGIRKRVVWVFRCSGCSREYDAKVKTCSVCGSQVRKSSKR